MRTLAVCLVAVFVLAGCAGNRWERTRAEDSLAGYRRFLNDAPRSPHADAARERIAYHELKRRPTLEGYEQFRAAHPDSPSLAELDALFEARTFESARASGRAAAYASFLEHFPNGSFAARARGNAEYLRERAFAGHPPEALAEFAERHPASDYAGEAQRTLRALDARQQARFATIGFHVELETPVADADRLVRTFRERAQQAYAAAGVRLVTGEPGARRVDGWITVRHRERAVSTEVDAGRMTGPGVLAETQVTLHRTGDDEPVWSETFTMRFADSERRSAG